MNDKKIKELTEAILNISHDGKEPHEFICALANARSFIENKLFQQEQKTIAIMHVKSFAKMLSGFHDDK